jgi:hypothetical protein
MLCTPLKSSGNDLVGHGFSLAAELLLGAACHKPYPNHVETPLVFASPRWPEGRRQGKSPAPHREDC